MSTVEREPRREELLAMAYADGELRGAEREEFEGLLATREDLRLEVVRMQRLGVLARQAAGPEPMDHEWRDLARDPVQRAAAGLGRVALIGGSCLVAIGAAWALWTSDAPAWLQLGASAAAVGLAILLGAAVRARLRTRAFDPYRDIVR
jgi:hypothetical protein